MKYNRTNSMQSVNHLSEEITKVVDYFRLEYELSYAEIIGTLAIIQSELENELQFGVMEEEDDEYQDANGQ